MDTKPRSLTRLTIAALIGTAWWLFGNVYEAIVFSPNWVVDSPAQLRRLNEFFVVTDPTLFFIPVSPIALVLVWVAAYVGRRHQAAWILRIAAVIAVGLGVLTTLIVTLILPTLFGEDYLAHADQLQAYATWWNIANVVRMVLTAVIAVLLFQAVRVIDRAG